MKENNVLDLGIAWGRGLYSRNKTSGSGTVWLLMQASVVTALRNLDFLQSGIRQFIVAHNSSIISKMAVMAAWEEISLAGFHFSLRFSRLLFRNTVFLCSLSA